MKKFLIVTMLLALTGCQRGCAKLSRTLEASTRDYTIVVFSGGDTVFVDTFTGIVNDSEASDGIYYYKNGELIEVSGDYVIRSR